MIILTSLNNFLAKVSYFIGILIVATMVMALSLSAITRYISGTGYDWLIELPPVLVCWLVFESVCGSHFTYIVTNGRKGFRRIEEY